MGSFMINKLAIACYVALTTASPLNIQAQREPEQVGKVPARRQWDNEDLGDHFKGINWDDVRSECSDEQYSVLIEVTFSASAATKLQADNHENSAAWNRYFNGANPEKDTRWLDDEAEPVYLNIRNNLIQVAEFPLRGKVGRKGVTRSKQVAYRCREIPGFSKCKAKNADGSWTGPSAYTADPRANESGWAIVFCPRFFGDERASITMSDRAYGARKDHTQIHELYTYEHILIHEWMHVDIFGYKQHILDLTGTIGHNWSGEHLIYGDKMCHYFAWKDNPELNYEVALNADTYAWFFTYNHFHNRWGWQSDGRFDTKRSIEARDRGIDWQDEILWDEASDYTAPTAEEDVEGIAWEAPLNVFMNEEFREDDGDSVVTVNYIGEAYADFVEAYEKKEDYDAEGSGCTLSWQCRVGWGHSLDPECTCKCEGKVVGADFWNDERCKGIAFGEKGV